MKGYLTVSKTKEMQFTDLPSSGYHQKYKNLKKKLKMLIYENECFLEELKKSQRKLLKVSCDKSFLLDRLLQFESVGSSSSDSEATDSSESDAESKTDLVVTKKKRVNNTSEGSDSVSTQQSNSSSKLSEMKKKKNRKLPSSKMGASKSSSTNSVGTGTRSVGNEQAERHTDAKQAMLHLIPEKTPLTLPVEIFSSEASALDCDGNDGGANESSPNNVAGAMSEDDGLIIDLHE